MSELSELSELLPGDRHSAWLTSAAMERASGDAASRLSSTVVRGLCPTNKTSPEGAPFGRGGRRAAPGPRRHPGGVRGGWPIRAGRRAGGSPEGRRALRGSSPAASTSGLASVHRAAQKRPSAQGDGHSPAQGRQAHQVLRRHLLTELHHRPSRPARLLLASQGGLRVSAQAMSWSRVQRALVLVLTVAGCSSASGDGEGPASSNGGGAAGASAAGASGQGAGGTPMVCIPGASVACVGPGACQGGQVCKADGSGLGPCDCGAGGAAPGGAGGQSAGGAGGSSAAGGGQAGAAGCTPLAADKACASNQCGVAKDGCGGEVACPACAPWFFGCEAQASGISICKGDCKEVQTFPDGTVQCSKDRPVKVTCPAAASGQPQSSCKNEYNDETTHYLCCPPS
jgi:hypothetical protein